MNEWIENHTSKPFIVNHFDPNFKDRPMYSQFTHYRNMNCSAMSFLGTGKRSISQIKVPLLWSATPCSTTYYYYYSLYIPSHSGHFLPSSAWSSIFKFKYWYFFPPKKSLQILEWHIMNICWSKNWPLWIISTSNGSDT